ncbi:hypothetical protein Tco_1018282 [Tanacetum coccineum]|uniref:Uncharacterized protein n=1 Tax=Tanacetum coccineum TaxID=301880 RepID=A0ABQ5FWH7_9ASTR
MDNDKSVSVPLGAHFKVSLKDCPSNDWGVERMSKGDQSRSKNYTAGETSGSRIFRGSENDASVVPLVKETKEEQEMIADSRRKLADQGMHIGK